MYQKRVLQVGGEVDTAPAVVEDANAQNEASRCGTERVGDPLDGKGTDDNAESAEGVIACIGLLG